MNGPMRNCEYPWHDRAIERLNNAVFNFIWRHGGCPPLNPVRFWLGWRVNELVCFPLLRMRRSLWRMRGWSA